MRRHWLALLLAVVIGTTASAEQRRPNLLVVNPADLLSGIVSLEYERGLNSLLGVSIGVSAWAFPGVFAFGQPSMTAIGPELGLRFHFIRDAPAGLWFGPSINTGVVIGSETTRVWMWGLGAAAGYNFVIGDHFVLQLGAGGGFVDSGAGLVWSPRFRLGLGGVF